MGYLSGMELKRLALVENMPAVAFICRNLTKKSCF